MSEFNEPNGSETPKGVSRRTVTTAMAWAVPVIAVAAAVPAYAASQVNISFLGGGCKLPGNSNATYKGYAFLVSVTNSSTVVVTIDITSITLGGLPLGSAALVNLANGSLRPDPIVLQPGESFVRGALVTSNAPNSQNNTLAITYTINGGVPINASASVPSVPPINGASCSTFTPGEKIILAASLGAGVPAWAPNTVYAVGDFVSVPGGFLSAIVAGTSGPGPAPTYPGNGGTVVDNTVTWQAPG